MFLVLSPRKGVILMTELDFVKINPAGNVTVIILDRVPRSTHGEISRQIMDPCGLGAEQVGFVGEPERLDSVARLQMMGGEFCGNASRAFAAWLALQKDSKIQVKNGISIVGLEVSGYHGLLSLRVQHELDQLWVSSPMPLPESVRFIPFRSGHLAFVEMQGISHAVIWNEEPSTEAFWEAVKICGTGSVPAFGVMFVNKHESKMVPIVRVKESASIVWEGSCASGSVAVAAALAVRNGCRDLSVRLEQPKGELSVNVVYRNKIVSAEVSGPVKIVAYGKVWIT